jgi:hypothetical protein
VDPVPDPLLLRKSSRAGNRTRDLWVSSQKLSTRPQRHVLRAHNGLAIAIHVRNVVTTSSPGGPKERSVERGAHLPVTDDKLLHGAQFLGSWPRPPCFSQNNYGRHFEIQSR